MPHSSPIDLSKREFNKTHHSSAWRRKLFIIAYLYTVPQIQGLSPSCSLQYHQHPEWCLPHRRSPHAYRLFHLLILQISKMYYWFPGRRYNFALLTTLCVQTQWHSMNNFTIYIYILFWIKSIEIIHISFLLLHTLKIIDFF